MDETDDTMRDDTLGALENDEEEMENEDEEVLELDEEAQDETDGEGSQKDTDDDEGGSLDLEGEAKEEKEEEEVRIPTKEFLAKILHVIVQHVDPALKETPGEVEGQEKAEADGAERPEQGEERTQEMEGQVTAEKSEAGLTEATGTEGKAADKPPQEEQPEKPEADGDAVELTEERARLRPSELQELINFRLGEKRAKQREMLDIVQKTLQYSVDPRAPTFLRRSAGSVNLYAVAAGWVGEFLQASARTRDMAPALEKAETMLLERMRKIIGYPKAAKGGGGVYCCDEVTATMHALQLARATREPKSRQSSTRSAATMVCFVSEADAEVMREAVIVLGFGLDHLVLVEADCHGRMRPDMLEKHINQVKKKQRDPLFVYVNAGNNVTDDMENLLEISRAVRRYKVWIHLQGRQLHALLSEDHANKWLPGIRNADSVCWRPDFITGGVAHGCALLVREPKHVSTVDGKAVDENSLTWCLQVDNPKGEGTKTPDLEQHQPRGSQRRSKGSELSTSQPTRKLTFGDSQRHVPSVKLDTCHRPDAFKTLLAWKAIGTRKVSASYSETLEKVKEFVAVVKARDGFHLVFKPRTVVLGFWYVPNRWRNLTRTASWWQQLGEVTCAVHDVLNRQGRFTLTIQEQPAFDWVWYFKVNLAHTCPGIRETRNELLGCISDIGERLYPLQVELLRFLTEPEMTQLKAAMTRTGSGDAGAKTAPWNKKKRPVYSDTSSTTTSSYLSSSTVSIIV